MTLRFAGPADVGHGLFAESVQVRGRVEAPEQPRISLSWEFGVVDALTLRFPDAGEWMFRAILDARQAPSGEHTVVIHASAGTEHATHTVGIVVDPERAWASFRSHAPAAEEPWLSGPGAQREHLWVIAADDDGAAQANEQAFGRAETRVASDGLPGALAEFAAGSLPWALVVERPGTLAVNAVDALLAAVGGAVDPDAVYGDEEDEAGRIQCRPAWSPDALLAGDDAGPVLLVGRDAARVGAEAGARDIRELLLALDPRQHRVAHVPRVLWRGPAAPPVAPGRPPEPPPARVSAVIATAYRDGLVDRCLASLAGEPALDVVLVDDGSENRARVVALCARLELPLRVITHPRPFNFSTASNLGAGLANGDELLFLNDDTECLHPGWLQAMRRWLHRPGVGAVGAKLVFPSGQIQHAGVTVGSDHIDNIGIAESAQAGWRTHNTTAVTGACVLVRRADFEAIGGFDPQLVLEYGDVDLVLRLARAGLRCVWTPDSELLHHESATRGRSGVAADRVHFGTRWRWLIAAPDPYGHPALDPGHRLSPRAVAGALAPREPGWSAGALERIAGSGQAVRLAQLTADLDGERVAHADAAQRLASADATCAQLAGELRLAQAARERAEVSAEFADRARDHIWAALGSVRASRSWRYTRPIRALGGLVRRR